MTETGPTSTLAKFAASLTYDDIPPEVVSHAKLCLLDTLGCGLFGSTLPWVRIVEETVKEVDHARVAALWGSSSTVSAPGAALVNGTAIHSFELDDLHPRSIVHPGAVVVSAALASAAHHGEISGQQLITAVVAGYEVAARVGVSMGAAHLSQGWHPTGTHGTLGAAAAAGVVLALTPEQMVHAIGTAGSQSSGLMSAQFSSMVKRLNAGHAAQAGVMAALLARRDFLGIPDLLENEYGGYLSTFSPTSSPELITENLGTVWQVSRVGFKPYSTNGSCHPTIDALLDMRAREHLEASDVERVTIHCSTATFRHVGWPYEAISVTSAQMNLSYIVAVVLTDGDAFIDQFSAERIVDPELAALARRVEVIPDPAIDAGGDAMRHQTKISVVLKDGTALQDERTHARGSAALPLGETDVEDKFFRLATTAISRDGAEFVKQLVASLESQPDVGVLSKALAG